LTSGSSITTEIHTSNPTHALNRQAKRRLAIIRHVEQVTGNVALSCRYYPISRQAYYTWYRRYCAEGLDGLHSRSKQPRTQPERHPHQGGRKDLLPAPSTTTSPPTKTAMYLTRYHDITITPLWRVAHPLNGPNLKPAARLAAVHPPRQAVETLATSNCPATGSTSDV
jgi:hypothetical protein